MISTYETIPVKTRCDEIPEGPGDEGGSEYRSTGGVGISLGPLGLSLETAGVNPLLALARLGRWCLDQAGNTTQSNFSVWEANEIDAKATELGLGYMEDMGTYEVFVETEKAKALDVDP